MITLADLSQAHSYLGLVGWRLLQLEGFCSSAMVFYPPCLGLCSLWWLSSHTVSINVQAFLRPLIRIGSSPFHSRLAPKVIGHPRIKRRKSSNLCHHKGNYKIVFCKFAKTVSEGKKKAWPFLQSVYYARIKPESLI